MKIHNVVQGSPEWLALRAPCLCASDAPVMMGASDLLSRSELVRMKATGAEREFSEWAKKNLLERGHAVEVFGRQFVEEMLGEELYPITVTDDEVRLLASSDGVVMDGTTGFEAKLWNEELAAMVRAKELSPKYYWQLEQQLHINEGMERVIFVVTDGTLEKTLWMEYRPVAGRVKQLLGGWKQFEEDVAAYKPVEVLPPVTATPKKDLPAVFVQIQGSLAVASNLDRFETMLREYIADIDLEPSDDQGFADAEAAIKTLQRAQEALEAAENGALAQIASVDDVRKTVAMLVKVARDSRLSLEKRVDKRKEQIRLQIIGEFAGEFAGHIAKLNERLGKPLMPAVTANFVAVMKGKKTVVGLRDAASTELARVKIEANEIADLITVNLRTITEKGAGFEELFADVAQLCTKDRELVAMTVEKRVNEHKAKEQKRREEEEAKKRADDQRAQAPAPAAAPASVSNAAPAGVALVAPTVAPAAKKTRPTDDEIIAALALHYRVHESTVIAWLLELDLKAASARMTSEFAA